MWPCPQDLGSARDSGKERTELHRSVSSRVAHHTGLGGHRGGWGGFREEVAFTLTSAVCEEEQSQDREVREEEVRLPRSILCDLVLSGLIQYLQFVSFLLNLMSHVFPRLWTTRKFNTMKLS